LAAATIAGVLEGRGTLDAYSQRIYEEFWPQLKAAVKMGLLFYPLSGFWSNVFVRNQTLLEDYLDVAMGIKPYHALQKSTERVLLAERGFGVGSVR
jgi:hypothetical protein